MVNENDLIEKKIIEFKTALKKKYDISKIILFGSYVKGKTHKNSDIDLAVICDDFRNIDRIELTQQLLKIAQSIDINIEPLGFTEEEYKKCDSRAFLSEIKRNGVEY